MGKLDGKVALITGGSNGIGLATARRFLTEGATHVFITGSHQDGLNEAVKKLNSKNVTAVRADASNKAELDHLYDVIKSEQGRLDILFANAGVYELASLGSISEEHFDRLFDVNVKDVLFPVQKALPLLVDGASIIFNASICSIKAFPDNSIYCTTKAAIFDSLTAGTVMGRTGTPDEIAKAAVFLASDGSSYITAIELFVDGGTA